MSESRRVSAFVNRPGIGSDSAVAAGSGRSAGFAVTGRFVAGRVVAMEVLLLVVVVLVVEVTGE